VSEPTYIFDGNRGNFRQLVIDNSAKGPVLVNYWMPGAGPCLRLWEILDALSQAYQGRFLLVNINTDKQKALLREHGISSVPALKCYRRGAVVESVYGVESEATLRKLIDKYARPAHDSAVAHALRAYQAGEVEAALIILVEAGTLDPHNEQLHGTAVKLLMRERRYTDIERYIAVLPESVRNKPDLSALRVHAKIAPTGTLGTAAGTVEQAAGSRPARSQRRHPAHRRRCPVATTTPPHGPPAVRPAPGAQPRRRHRPQSPATDILAAGRATRTDPRRPPSAA